jgi:DHA2 family multidrug resistance protein
LAVAFRRDGGSEVRKPPALRLVASRNSAHAARPSASPSDLFTPRNLAGWALMVVGMFMAILDIQIVASSLGEIQGGLSAAPDEIAWVQTSYLIAEVVMIPLSGFLARLLSTRLLFVLSAAGFTLASIACAFVDDLGTMVVARAIQGFVGGAMIPTVFATSYLIFPGHRQATMSVIIGMVATMAPTIGPTLGGWLTTSFSWHWLFLVNIVPGIIVTCGVWALLDIDRPDWSLLEGFDLTGLVAMAAFLGGLQYVLDEGPKSDWLSDETVRFVSLLMLVGACTFFWRVLTHFNPIVDLRCFRNRNFAVGSLLSFILGVGLYGSVFLTPLFLGRVRDFTAFDIGIVMAVTGIAQLACAPIAGRLSTRVDLRTMLIVGIALFALGLWLNTGLTTESGLAELALPQALRGVALLLCFIPINRLSLATMPPAELKNASGVFNLTRNLGGAVGLAVLSTFINSREQLHWNRLGTWIDAGRPVVRATIDTLTARFENVLPGEARLAALKQIGTMVHQQALVLTFNDAFLILSLTFLSSLLLMPLLRRTQVAVITSDS